MIGEVVSVLLTTTLVPMRDKTMIMPARMMDARMILATFAMAVRMKKFWLVIKTNLSFSVGFLVMVVLSIIFLPINYENIIT